jgi:hypothetical protein
VEEKVIWIPTGIKYSLLLQPWLSEVSEYPPPSGFHIMSGLERYHIFFVQALYHGVGSSASYRVAKYEMNQLVFASKSALGT